MRPVTKPPPRVEILAEWLSAPVRKPIPLTLIRDQLQATLGNYCSFCEMPINVTQAVASKRSLKLPRVPTLTQWDDLLLACDFCQLHRTRSVANLSDYLWPDVDATFSLGSTSPFIYSLREVLYVVNPDTEDRPTDPSTKQMVIVAANPQSSFQSQAQNTIDLFQLNTPFYDAVKNTFTVTTNEVQSRIDPRVDLRTQAWKMILESIEYLRDMQQESTDAPRIFLHAVRITAALAQVTGFWSCWMTLLWQAFADTKLIRDLLLEISNRTGYQVTGFQTLPDGGSPPWTLFTGTAVARLTS